MTFGQYLAQRSGLLSATLMDHLQAMQSGGGSGETIYTTMMLVSVTQPSVRVKLADATPALRHTNSVSDKLAYAHTEMASGYILSSVDSLIVLSITQ